MRKRLLTPTPLDVRPHDEGWLDLDRAAVEVTSEEKDYEIDSALVSEETQGWRAASPGTQTICSSINRKGSTASRSLWKKKKQSAPKSLYCDALRTADTHFERLCASNGISAHLTQPVRSRNITFNSRMSPFSN
jgi:hypothetical protein